jgi:hypothetical protein
MIKGMIRSTNQLYLEKWFSTLPLNAIEFEALCVNKGKRLQQFCLLDHALLFRPKLLPTLLKRLSYQSVKQWVEHSVIQDISISPLDDNQTVNDNERIVYANGKHYIHCDLHGSNQSYQLTIDWLTNKTLEKNDYFYNLLNVFAHQGNVEAVQCLLEQGVSYKKDSAYNTLMEQEYPAIINAACEGHLNCVKVLFEYDSQWYQESKRLPYLFWKCVLEKSIHRIPWTRLKPVMDYALANGIDLPQDEDIRKQFSSQGFVIQNEQSQSPNVVYQQSIKRVMPTDIIVLKKDRVELVEEKMSVQEESTSTMPASVVQSIQPWKGMKRQKKETDEKPIPRWKQPPTDVYAINEQQEQQLKSSLYDDVYKEMVCSDADDRANITTLKQLSPSADYYLNKTLLNITSSEESDLIRRLKMLSGCQASLLTDIKERFAENRQRAGRPEEVPSNDYPKKKRLNLAYRAKRLDASLAFLKEQEKFLKQEEKNDSESTEYTQVILMGVERNATELKPWFEWLTHTQARLQMLDLSENPIGSFDADDKSEAAAQQRLQPLLDYLRDNTTITVLKLNNAQLTGTDLGLIMAVLEERPVALKEFQRFNNRGLTTSNQRICQSHLNQLDEQVALLTELPEEFNDREQRPLVRAINAEYHRAYQRHHDDDIDTIHPINTFSVDKTIFEEIPTPANGHCGFYGLLDDPFAVFRPNQEEMMGDADNPFVDGDTLLALAHSQRTQVKSVLLAPFQTPIESKSEENDDDEDIAQGDPVKQTLIAEHLQEEVNDFFSKHSERLPRHFQETHQRLQTAQEKFDIKKAALSAQLQPYDDTLKRSTYRGFAHLPPMEAPYKDLRDYLIMLQNELQLDQLPDSDGKLIKIVETDLAQWNALLQEKESLAEKTSQFYTNPALTKVYLQEAFDGQQSAWLGRYSAHLYGVMSGKGVEIYTRNPKTGALAIDTTGQLNDDAKQILSPPASNANTDVIYRLHYTRTQFSQYPNHFTRLVPKDTAKKHLNAIPHTAQQYRQAYRRYYALLISVAAAFTPAAEEKARIHEKINQERALTPRELLKIKAGVLEAQLDKLPDPNTKKDLPLKEPKTQWNQLREAYLNFMPLPTKDTDDGTPSPLIRLGQAMLTVDNQLNEFEAREARQQQTIRDIELASPLNMPLTPKEWALKTAFLQKTTHLYAAANTILSGLVENDHDLSKSEEAWRCAKAGILGVASFVGGVGEIVHTLGNAGNLLHKVIKHGKVGKFASEAFEAFEKIPGIEKGIHTLVHFSKKAIEKVTEKEFLTTHKKLEHLSCTFVLTSTHDQYLEDLINHFIYAYKAQIVTLADQEEAAKWGKALAEHTLQAIFAGVVLGYEFSTIDNFTHYMTQWIEYIPMANSPTLHTLTHGKVSADTLIKAPLPVCQTEDGQRVVLPLNPFTIHMQDGYTKYRCKKETFDYPGSNPAYGQRIANIWEVNALQHESKEACAFHWPNVAKWTLEMGDHHIDQDTIKTVKPIDCPWKNPRALVQQVNVLDKRVERLEEKNEQLEKDNKSLKTDSSKQKETTESLQTSLTKCKKELEKSETRRKKDRQEYKRFNTHLKGIFTEMGINYTFEFQFEDDNLEENTAEPIPNKSDIDTSEPTDTINTNGQTTILNKIRFYQTNQNNDVESNAAEPNQSSIQLSVSHD